MIAMHLTVFRWHDGQLDVGWFGPLFLILVALAIAFVVEAWRK